MARLARPEPQGENGRCLPDLRFETPLWAGGSRAVAGLDEVGRGALAGPVVAAAVVLPADPDVLTHLSGVRDSKQMTARQRHLWAGEIRARAAAWAVGRATHLEIEALNIVGATRLAMQRALEALPLAPDALLLDALRLPAVSCPQEAIIHGDTCCLSIAAASVLAKTDRDALMVELDARYPGYGWAENKGYGTAAHQRALRELGPSPLHRRTFAPVRIALGEIPPYPESD